MDSVNRFFLMAAGLIITTGLIIVAFRMADIGTETAGQVMEEYIQFGSKMRESEILQYDGTQVSGSDVRNFLRKYLPDNYGNADHQVPVTVITGRGKMEYQSYTEIKEINNYSHITYINPKSLFWGTVERNENGVICKVRFEQR